MGNGWIQGTSVRADRGISVLYIAYPLLTVSAESAGGAEQMLWTLEREMALRGIITTVAASSGSHVRGELLVTGEPCSRVDDFERRNQEHHCKIIEFVRCRAAQSKPFDLVHDKSGSFWPCAAEIDAPVLATLHLPRHFYLQEYFQNIPENVRFNCVSQSQSGGFSDLRSMMGIVPNGISVEHFEPNFGARAGLLWLGRICEEKGTHLALEIAARAGMSITVAGQVYPFSYHQAYFEREVRARLAEMPDTRLVCLPSVEQKRELLRFAKAVLITSLVEETSSLVAMEAAASGTPVIAFGRGALPEIVKEGVTGFLVEGVEEAVQALAGIGRIDPASCRRYAQENFSSKASKAMVDGYLRVYERMIKDHQANSPAPALGGIIEPTVLTVGRR